MSTWRGTRSRSRALSVAALAALICLALGATTALADIDIFTSGTVGEHSLPMDTVATGGVICRYDGMVYLVGATMRPPIVYAIDKNGQRNSGVSAGD